MISISLAPFINSSSIKYHSSSINYHSSRINYHSSSINYHSSSIQVSEIGKRQKFLSEMVSITLTL